MTDEELKKKCTERAKIFQQAMESCHSSSPMDCIEWFADRIAELEDKLANADYQLEGRDNEIAELEQENKVLAQNLEDTEIVNKALEKENAELKKLKRECETSLCRAEYQYNYEQLTKAKELVKEMSKSLFLAKGIVRDLIDDTVDFKESKERALYCYKQEAFDAYKKAEQFLKEVEK